MRIRDLIGAVLLGTLGALMLEAVVGTYTEDDILA